MPYMTTMNRNQIMMCSLDDFVDPQSIARVIDAFVAGLDLSAMGFTRSTAKEEGRPCYAPQYLLKLYLYGNQKGIRSSRKLEEACRVNIEVRWLMEGLEPDFRTISDFRKDNTGCMKKVFHEFNRRMAGVLTKGFLSVDGSKFQANNSKDNNFTANKLDDRIAWLNSHSDEYLRQIAEMDAAEEELSGEFTREELEEKLREVQDRLEKYKSYRDLMEKEGLSQLSITDADAKLMKNKNGFAVAYNVQTAVDSETHMIEDFQVTNNPTDHGLIESTVEEERKRRGGIVDVVADKGYEVGEDMVHCLENGILPHVILPDGQDTYELELEYKEAEITEEKSAATTPEALSDCLHAGVAPKAYGDAIEKIEVVERRVRVETEPTEPRTNPYGTEEEMIERAKEGYFVRDPERNVVYCPAGETLRQKSVKNNGNIRYANKLACRHCKFRNQCYKGKNEWKEVDFNKDTLEKPNRVWREAVSAEEAEDQNVCKRKRGSYKYEVRKVVRLVLKPDRRKMSERLCISEHPFGTIKRTMNGGYYLLKGREKVGAETALLFLGYNMKRALNLLGFHRLMAAMTANA